MDRTDELRQRLALAERLVRVDTALAKRVGDHIARDSELLGWLQQLAQTETDAISRNIISRVMERIKNPHLDT